MPTATKSDETAGVSVGTGVRFGIPHRHVTDVDGKRWACFQRDTVSDEADQARSNYALALRASVGMPPPPSPAMVAALGAVRERRRQAAQREDQDAARRLHLLHGDAGPHCPECAT
jgi:hypothetical protein